MAPLFIAVTDIGISPCPESEAAFRVILKIMWQGFFER
jgi:hypothetical protein